MAARRQAQPALRYGRLYFRPISAPGGTSFGISPFSGGVIAWSRILNDQEVVVVANTHTSQTLSVQVILEIGLSQVGAHSRVLYSNKTASVAPGPVTNITKATVVEVDGTTGSGPLHVLSVTLAPSEVQILRQ